MRLLLVEDDELLGDGLKAGLEEAGYTVDWLRDGVAASLAPASADFDAAVLDLGLPRQDGLKTLRSWRQGGPGAALPVLILTARDTVQDRVAGLDAGADDYLIKPFDLHELLARLRAIVRRRAGSAAPLWRHGAVCYDPAARQVTVHGRPVALSSKELAIFEVLLLNAGRVLSRQRLEESLYGWEDAAESNTVEVFIHHLRRKLGPGLIKTVRGVGYLLPREPQ